MEAMWDFKEGADYYLIDDHLRYYDRDLDRKYDDSLVRNLRVVGETYTFSESEKKAAIFLYRYIRPFNDPVVDELKKVGSDNAKVGMLLDWIENQIIRDDLDFESILA